MIKLKDKDQKPVSVGLCGDQEEDRCMLEYEELNK